MVFIRVQKKSAETFSVVLASGAGTQGFRVPGDDVHLRVLVVTSLFLISRKHVSRRTCTFIKILVCVDIILCPFFRSSDKCNQTDDYNCDKEPEVPFFPDTGVLFVVSHL
jgi:hypothetical protein